jgi:short-subunit dehydrogenase
MPLPSPVLILGARSDIARALAHAYAAEGCDLILAARRSAELADDATDLRLRHGVQVTLAEFDVLDPAVDAFFDRLVTFPGTVVMVAGLLGDQKTSEADYDAADLVMRTNYNGPARYLLAAARRMEARGSGAIVGISSVAGDRGRASNFVYGSAKAGFTALLSGVRNRLARKGVTVLTVKPGFVATRMTAGMDLKPKLTARPEEVARAIVAAQRRGRDVLYVKPIWRVVMTVIGLLPEGMFKRTSF